MGVEEILVHLSGPGSKKDDRRFQAMALAYDTFQPATVHTIVEKHVTVDAIPDSIDESILQPAPAPTSSTLSESSSTQVPRTALKGKGILAVTDGPASISGQQAQCTYIEDTPLAAAAIESQLWSSPGQNTPANASSPLGNRAAKRQRLSPEHELSNEPYHSAPSGPRVPEVCSIIVQRNATRDTPPFGVGISSSPIRYISSHESLDIVPATAPARVDSQATIAPQTQIRVTAHTAASSSPILAPSSPEAPSSSVATFKTAPRTAESPPSSSLKAVSANEGPHFASIDFPAPATVPARPSPDPHPTLAPTAPPTPAIPTPNHAPPSSPPTWTKTILPPPPAVGHLPTPPPNSTIPITPTLIRIFSKPELNNRYKPVHQTRALRPFERGHWRIDTSTWTGPDVQAVHADFWNSLRTFVEGGKVGWDGFVVREDILSDAHVHADADVGVDVDVGADMRSGVERKDGVTEDTRLGTIRFYHFGGVAVHIYLLLFITSKSRIRKCRVEWVDAGGEVVIGM